VPAERVRKLHGAFRQIAASDEFRARVEPTGFTPVTDETPAEFGAYWRAQEQVWKDLVETSGATLD
jgi:tripartite-type tricarboxylate transporter receptor subunit TctC